MYMEKIFFPQMLKIPFIIKISALDLLFHLKRNFLCRNEKSSMLKFIIVFFKGLNHRLFDGYGQVVSFKQN